MKNIKAIIFDAYGTLFDVNSAAEKCKDKIGDKWEPFANFWRTTQLEYTWLRSLMGRHKDFWKITEDSLDKSMKSFQIHSSMRDELLNLYKVLSPFKEVHETLKTLKEKKFKLAILSNGTPSLLNELVKSNNLENFFDDIFSIEEVGIYKQNSKVYDIPIKKYKITDLITFHHGIFPRVFLASLGLNIFHIVSERNSLKNYDFIKLNKINLGFLSLFFAQKITRPERPNGSE